MNYAERTERLSIEELKCDDCSALEIDAYHKEDTGEWFYKLCVHEWVETVSVDLTEDEMRKIAELYERNHSKGEKE